MSQRLSSQPSPAPLHAADGRLPPAKLAAAVKAQVTDVVVGHDEVVELCLIALFARGHILLEDVPGVGKTTLGRALARSLGLSFSRVQFTSDLLPSDILGSAAPETRADGALGPLVFQPGPIFASVVLADELNRTTPRTQSALLEAMADGKVTVDGTTHPLPRPFLVIATQNPLEHHGTYPLPESQLDRFAVRISLGYPDRASERDLLLTRRSEDPIEAMDAVCGPEAVLAAQAAVDEARVEPAVADYVLTIATATREDPRLAAGASTRAALEWLRLARARALLRGRDFVTPADVKVLAVPALAHRLVVAAGTDPTRSETEAILDEILARVAVPE